MPFDATAWAGIAPLLVFLVMAALGINAAVFVGRRVTNHLVAYPLAMLIGLLLFVLGGVLMTFSQSFFLLSR